MPKRKRKRKPTFVSDNGYVIDRTGGRLRSQHRVVYELYHGPIPPGYVVHHRNNRRDDNSPKNLIAVTRKEHAALHRDVYERLAKINSDLAKTRNRLPNGRFAKGYKT